MLISVLNGLKLVATASGDAPTLFANGSVRIVVSLILTAFMELLFDDVDATFSFVKVSEEPV